jgi:indolepyruvate ferredoxin oxidoreductase alpha subunit
VQGDKGGGATSIDGTGIIASSAGYNYAVEACRIMGITMPILKLGTTFPIPTGLISDFIRPLKRVVIVEELAPISSKR